MESKFFIYDGIKSTDMGLYLVHVDQGMVETPYFGGAQLDTEQYKDKIQLTNWGIEYQPLTFDITLTPLDREWTPELRRKLGQWLFQSEFKEFQTADDLGKFYYAMPVAAENFNLYSTKGYITITMQTNSPYAWSPTYIEAFDLSDNSTSEFITLRNQSNVQKYYRPKIEIQNKGSSGYNLVNGEKRYRNPIKLINHSFEGKTMDIQGFEGKDEIISLDCDNEIILSSLHNSKPFKRMGEYWLELVPGENLIEIEGKCKIWTKMQFPILQ